MTAARIAETTIDADLETTGGGALRCTGGWTCLGLSRLERAMPRMAWPSGDIVIDVSGLSAMDTAGAWMLRGIVRRLGSDGRRVTLKGLQPEHETLLRLVETAAASVPQGTAQAPPGALENLGRRAWLGFALPAAGILAFTGECGLALFRSLLRPSRIRWRPILYNVQTAGVSALFITGLLSFLMGVVIAYQGAEQLRYYGANIFVVDLVGLSMLRELSPLLTAIIVAGRSGSAYAAQIGTMKVTDEIAAMRTIGISPMELLVIPKLLALMLALPLLTVFADVTGVLGGMVMASTQLDVSYAAFLDRFGDAITLSSFLIGIGKAPVFAAIIAVVGCYQGFQVTGSAESVGRQTTISVVQGIFFVIVADALFSIVFSQLGL